MINVVKELLKRPVAYHPIFAKITGSVPAAVMLSQGIYWQGKADEKGEQWFQVTGTNWFEQTGLSTDAQLNARKILRSIGVWHEVKKGVPAQLYFRIDTDALVSVITGYSVSGFPGNKKPGIPRASDGKYRKQETGNPGIIESNKEIKETNIESSSAATASALTGPFEKVDEIEIQEPPKSPKKEKTPPGSARPPKKEKDTPDPWTKRVATLFDRVGAECGIAEPFNWQVNAGRDFKALKEIRKGLSADISRKKAGAEPTETEIETGFEYLFRYGYKYLSDIASQKGGAVQYNPTTIKNCYNQIISYARSKRPTGTSKADQNRHDMAEYLAVRRQAAFARLYGEEMGTAAEI